MTETTELPRIVPPFSPIAFTVALIGAPLLVTLVGGVFLIPIAALIFGGPVYLIAGTPVLLWMVGRYPPAFDTYACAGLITNMLIFLLVCILTSSITKGTVDLEPLALILIWGTAFAPIWAGTFGYLYARFTRSNPT